MTHKQTVRALALLAGIALAGVSALATASPQTGATRTATTQTMANTPDSTTTSREIPAGPVVEMTTSKGPVRIKLYDDTPLHRDNFLKLVSEHYYDSVLFHRVIKDFMVQTGDPKSKNAPAGVPLGTGDPGYTLPAEIKFPTHWHRRGALAAARTGDQVNPEKRSSGSQFYIVTGSKMPRRQVESILMRQLNGPREAEWRRMQTERRDEIIALRRAKDNAGLDSLQEVMLKELDSRIAPPTLDSVIVDDYVNVGGAPHLDGDYTVFGEVLEGMDVIEAIEAAETDRGDRPVEDIRILGIKVVE